MFTIFVIIITAKNFHLPMLVLKDVRVFRNTLQIYRSKKRPFSQGFIVKECDWVQQKIISFCNFPAQEFECTVCCPIGNVTSCALCIGYHLNVINIIVETNYEAYYKMKLQNLWGTFIDLKVLTVSYIFFYDVLRNIWLTLFGGMAEYMQSVVKYGIYVIL